MRAGAWSCGRRLGAWLGAAHGIPAGSILGEFTHFAAARGSFGLRAVAVATSGCLFAGSSRGVGGSREGQSAGKEGEVERSPNSEAVETAEERRIHRGIFKQERTKTYGAGLLVVLLPGSWYQERGDGRSEVLE